jgi:hypothetical protein
VAACGAIILILGIVTTGRWALGTAALLEPVSGKSLARMRNVNT